MELKGKAVADFYKEKINKTVRELAAQGSTIGLGILLVGEDKAAAMYGKFMERKACEAGFQVEVKQLSQDATQAEVETAVRELNESKAIHGILPLMPMPKHIDTEAIIESISPEKDIDGLTIKNIGLFNAGKGGFVPCTPRACLAILDYYKIPIEGKKVVVVGRSAVVGKPVAQLLLNRHATVSICHSRSLELADEVRTADIVIATAGKAHLITGEMIKPGAVVIDVGINELDGQTVGDVDFESAVKVAGAITPVPGGVGVVTTTMLLEALCEAHHA